MTIKFTPPTPKMVPPKMTGKHCAKCGNPACTGCGGPTK